MSRKQFKEKLRTLLLDGCERINLHLAYGKGIIPHVNVDQAVDIFMLVAYPNEESKVGKDLG